MSRNIAIIPVRKGSKGIPGKNKKKLLGRPLFSWVVCEALKSELDTVYLYTDDEEIINFAGKEYAKEKKLLVIKRSGDDAKDTSSTEDAMKLFTKAIDHEYENIMLLQATSPLTTAEDINSALDQIEKPDCDSVISLVNEKRFIWDKNGKSLNYDYNNRPRRQDFEGLLIENGAIYCTTKKQFEDSGIRLGGRIKYIEMPSDTFVEIDEPSDFVLIEELLKRRLKTIKGVAKKIKALVLDVDGVFTTASITYSNSGEFSKEFNMRDGMGIEILRENGVIPIVMTSENSEIVRSRMQKLNISHLHLGVKDKFFLLGKELKKLELNHSEVAYLGDDRNDLANILACGWGICPNDAVGEVRVNADTRLNASGGQMAIREAVEFILNFNKRFN